MTLSRQKIVLIFRLGTLPTLPSLVSGSLPVAVVGGLVDVERQDLNLKYLFI
jgi:hypothetical protein